MSDSDNARHGSSGGGSGDGGGGGSTHIGSISNSAVSTGSHGRAEYHAAPSTADDVQLLLEAVRALRRDMRVLTASGETAAVDGELAAVQGEIERTGSPDPGRLGRLRELLTTGATAVGAIASAAAVTEAIGKLLA
jgi:hypothetical protein